MSDADDEHRRLMRQATRRQLTILVPMVFVLALVLGGVDVVLGHATFALIWFVGFLVILAVISVVQLRR